MDSLSTKVTVSDNGGVSTYWRDNPLLVAAFSVFGSPMNVIAHLLREELELDSPMHLVAALDAGRNGRETAQQRRVPDALSDVSGSDTVTETSSVW